MSMIWVCLQSPDLAITEAAVGAGITSILFFATLKKIHAIDIEKDKEDKAEKLSAQEEKEAEVHE